MVFKEEDFFPQHINSESITFRMRSSIFHIHDLLLVVRSALLGE